MDYVFMLINIMILCEKIENGEGTKKSNHKVLHPTNVQTYVIHIIHTKVEDPVKINVTVMFNIIHPYAEIGFTAPQSKYK